MSASVSLSQLADLALGTPEVGAVNFNVLHTLLHAIIQKAGLSDSKANINEADKDFLIRKKEEPDFTDIDKDSAVTGLTDDSFVKDRPSSNKAPYHQLEEKVAQLQKQYERLNELPSNSELFEGSRSRGDGTVRPVNDMWQAIQMKNRVDANEDGVNKLMSLVQDLIGEVNQMKEDNANLKKQMEDIKNMSDIMDRLKSLENQMNELNDKMSILPGPDVLNDFVTWQALEDSLKGLKENLEELRKPPTVIEMSMQTEAVKTVSRPVSARPLSRASTPGPSDAMLELLEKIGKLSDRHDQLEERVDKLEGDLNNKADKDSLEGIGVPDDLLQQLKDLQQQIEHLKKLANKDSDALSRMQQAVLNIQAELERLDKVTQQLMDENLRKQKDIESLFEQCSKLEDSKADKEYVQTEVEVKADKRLVDGKVNRSLFDTTCDELNKMISDILSKLSGHDEEWKKALARLSDDMDGKLDRLEFGPIRDALEKQLRALMKKLNQIHYPQYEDDEAAGVRKQLIQRFHCISCDRAVDMQPQGPVPSIPAPAGLPATKSTRPYTTFELEQIRQHAKRLITNKYDPSNVQQPMIDVMDLYATQRACGGSHTMTYPHKRMTRMSQINNLFRDDEQSAPTYRNELEIQGADGHVYKGRHDPNRLPNLSAPGNQMTSRSPKLPRRAHTSMEPSYPVAPPDTAPSPRPGSARVSRPSSARHQARPVSARGALSTQLTEVPTGQMTEEMEGSPPPPPPGPAPSEPDEVAECMPPPARSPSPRGAEEGGED